MPDCYVTFPDVAEEAEARDKCKALDDCAKGTHPSAKVINCGHDAAKRKVKGRVHYDDGVDGEAMCRKLIDCMGGGECRVAREGDDPAE
jgi:hypothetical protein